MPTYCSLGVTASQYTDLGFEPNLVTPEFVIKDGRQPGSAILGVVPPCPSMFRVASLGSNQR